MTRLFAVRAIGLMLALCSLAILAGCGGSTPRTVTGKVVLLPTTKLVETDTVNVIFVPEQAGGATPIADVSPKDLTFTTQVPPGKYKVAFSVTPYAGEPNSEKRTTALEQVNQPFSPDATTLSYEVTSDANQSITIDLAQGRVAKN